MVCSSRSRASLRKSRLRGHLVRADACFALGRGLCLSCLSTWMGSIYLRNRLGRPMRSRYNAAPAATERETLSSSSLHPSTPTSRQPSSFAIGTR
jgi:hypothetical protein